MEKKREIKLKGTKYIITGKIDAGDMEKLPKELKLRAYAVRDGKVLGTAMPDPKGSFSIEFIYPLETPIGVNVIVAPDVPPRFYPDIVTKNARIETLKFHISAPQWKTGESLHHDLGTIRVASLVDFWKWFFRLYHVNGTVVCKRTGKGISNAMVEAFHVRALTGGGFAQYLMGSTVTGSSGNFGITFRWCLIFRPPEGRPDLIFRVSQKIDSSVNVLYREDTSQTHWNVMDDSYITLEVEGDCITISDPDTDQPDGPTFLFTRVGLIGVSQIDSNGYAQPSASGGPPWDWDAPFGTALHLCGWFGKEADVTHYQIQFQKDGGTPMVISDPLSNQYHVGYGEEGHWVTVAMGPCSLGPPNNKTDNLYTTPVLFDRMEGLDEPRPWWMPDLLAQWDTTKADGDGQYTITIKGYKWDGTTLSDAGSLVIDPVCGEIKLQIDNTPPISDITDIRCGLQMGPNPAIVPCAITPFIPGDTLTVNFKAYDANGHLGGYWLDAIYGDNCYVKTKLGEDPLDSRGKYSDHRDATQKWEGGNLSTKYNATDYDAVYSKTCSIGNMPTCGYQFRLRVWKRTTNGYWRIYDWVEDTYGIIIQRPGQLISP
jgi:hypothetical protein